jgi:TfoX/Sxy family transcriptional regulator of competence genes
MPTMDARFADLARALGGQAGVELAAARRGFGGGTLKVDGRIFAMVSGGRLVLKLPADRVAGLLSSGQGLPFDANKGRPMREWVALAEADDDTWHELALEAAAFVASRPASRRV